MGKEDLYVEILKNYRAILRTLHLEELANQCTLVPVHNKKSCVIQGIVVARCSEWENGMGQV